MHRDCDAQVRVKVIKVISTVVLSVAPINQASFDEDPFQKRASVRETFQICLAASLADLIQVFPNASWISAHHFSDVGAGRCVSRCACPIELSPRSRWPDQSSDCVLEVTESARAHSYYSISTGVQTVRPPVVPILHPCLKSVLCTACSVKKLKVH